MLSPQCVKEGDPLRSGFLPHTAASLQPPHRHYFIALSVALILAGLVLATPSDAVTHTQSRTVSVSAALSNSIRTRSLSHGLGSPGYVPRDQRWSTSSTQTDDRVTVEAAPASHTTRAHSTQATQTQSPRGWTWTAWAAIMVGAVLGRVMAQGTGGKLQTSLWVTCATTGEQVGVRYHPRAALGGKGSGWGSRAVASGTES